MKKAFSFVIAILSISVSAQSPDGKEGNPTGLSSPGWKIDFATSRDYVNSKSLLYYKIAYKGNTIKEEGSQLTPATFGGAWPIPKVASDSDEFKLDLVDGFGTINSPIFDMLALKPIKFLAPFGDFRGAVQVSGKLTNSQELNVGFGLETRPYSPFRNRILDLTNQVRVGIMGVKHTDNAGSKRDFLAFTYRAYVGTGFGYVRSYKLDDLTNDIVTRYAKLSPDDQAKLMSSGAPSDPLVQSLKLMSAAERKDPAKAKEYLKSYYDARIDQPSVSIEASAEASYTPDNFVNRRYNSLWSTSVYWWPNPHAPDSGKFFITYQNGYTRADLTNAVTGLIAGFSLKF